MKNWLLFVLFWLPFLSSGQIVTVSEKLSIRNNGTYELLGKMGEQVLLYRKRSGQQFEIQAYDEQLRLTWNKVLQFDQKKANVIAMIPNQDELSVIYGFKEKGTLYLKANKYDAQINLIDSTTIASYSHRLVTPNFQVTYSEDRQHALIFSIQNQSKVKALSFHLQSMQLLWENEFSIAVAQFYTNPIEVLTTNKGELYLIISHDNRRSSRDQHLYEVLYCRQGLKQAKRMAISMEGRLSFDAVFSYDNLNRNLVAGGLYAQKNLNRANGYFSLKLPSQSPEKYQLKFIPFEDTFISDIGGKKIKDSKGLKNIAIRDIIFRRDGGMLLVFETARLHKRKPNMVRV
ncbi:MAG: hypothetical protein AAF985_04360, partial [Bacteroidota bacterium]